MNLLDVILNAQNGAAIQQAGASVGLNQDQTLTALSALVPALAGGLKQNTASPDGLAGLIGALTGGTHQRYLDNPANLGQANAVSEGNGILGHILGSKDASRQLASQASASTGISADVLKRLLPIAATLVMGALAKQRLSNNATADPTGGVIDMLGSLLGGGGKSSSAGVDIASMIGKMLR